ncbi:MAG: hypothetical protein HUN04_07610 [Desulfobacter sp.]|nr:MAG: hypothetical protein HUN04_07610 [Desulfobacter sp.]
MTFLRSLGAMFISLVLLISLPAPGRTGNTAHPSAERDNVLRFAVHVSKMGQLDPHFAAASQDRTLADMVFNGLLRYTPGNAPAIEPDLASEMPQLKMDQGHQVWTVRLRRGVMFHPGPMTPSYELTADDVVYSFAKAADPKRSTYAGDYEGMTVGKIDKYTVEITLAQPISSILFFPKITNYNGGFIVSRKAIEKMGEAAYQKHPVGTGPFMFKSYDPGSGLHLEAHGDYFRGKPALDGVHLYFLPNTEERRSGLLSGRFDVIIGSGKKGFAKALLTHPGIEIDPHGPGEVTTIYFNTGIPPMDDIRVRTAITRALNRNEFLDVYDGASAGPVFSPVPADFLPGGLTAQEVSQLGVKFEEDLSQARALLSQAGFPNGFKLELVGSEKRIYSSFYGVLKKQLARIGIDCHVTILSHSEMHKTIRNDPRPIVIYTAWRPNADVFLSRFFHSNSILVTGKKPDTNFAGYNAIDKLIEGARLEIDPAKQISLWQQAQIRILNDKVAYPVLYAIMNTPRRSDVDYGHPLKASMALYPQFTEKTRLLNRQ